MKKSLPRQTLSSTSLSDQMTCRLQIVVDLCLCAGVIRPHATVKPPAPSLRRDLHLAIVLLVCARQTSATSIEADLGHHLQKRIFSIFLRSPASPLSGHQVVQFGGPNINSMTTSSIPIQLSYQSGVVTPILAQAQFVVPAHLNSLFKVPLNDNLDVSNFKIT